MATIQVTPELLLDQAGKMREKIAQQERLYRDIRSQVQNITSVWKGKSQSAFWASFDARDKQLGKFAEDMETFAQLMQTAAEEHDHSETYRTKLMQQGVTVGSVAVAGAGVVGVAAVGVAQMCTAPNYANAPQTLFAPNLNGNSYSEYNNGAWFDGVLYKRQCVGYAKGRLSEQYGIQPKGGWGGGGDAAANIAINNATVQGRDGAYQVIHSTNTDGLRAGSVVSFGPTESNSSGHVVFVEDVWRDSSGAVQVKFTEANVGGADGVFKTLPLNGFTGLPGGMTDFVYFDKL